MSAMILEVSARIGAAIAAAAGSHGPAVCAAVGFDPARASDPDARIPLELETALWDEAARSTGDDAFGLHAAEQVRPGAFDVLDYAIRTAPTFRASFDRLARYNRLVHDAAVFTVTDDATRTRVEHALRFAGATQSRHAAEFTLACFIVVGAQMRGAPTLPRAVDFRHAAPLDVSEHARRFGVAPRVGAAVNAIEYDRALIEQPLASADPALSSVIERHAEALLAARPEPVETTANRARRLLGAMLGEGEVSLASVAQRLHMSERTLQRHLAAENVTFDALLDELRRDLALRYLADAKLAIAEVAYLLGYSEPSAFHRAFKR
jgi:AraC-like DNA-binding protein